jgi:dihydroorotase
MNTMEFRRPDDFHVHLRRNPALRSVLPFTANVFARALVMPNTSPSPILTAADALEYRNLILDEAKTAGFVEFEPLMTIQITDDTTPQIIREAKQAGVIAGKIYPKAVTTNSSNGATDFEAFWPVFAEMQQLDMVLSLHGQATDAFCLDREAAFLPTLFAINEAFPRLRIVLEHVSTDQAARAVQQMPETVAATITAHHLVLSLHDVLSWKGEDGSEGLNPHHYCQPIPQHPEDRESLIALATSGSPKFFFGSDSAPHPRENKESSCGCAGVFSAPVALPLLAEIFSRHDRLDRLGSFVSESGARFYGLPLNEGTIRLSRAPWHVAAEYDGIVPLFAGRLIEWAVVD